MFKTEVDAVKTEVQTLKTEIKAVLHKVESNIKQKAKDKLGLSCAKLKFS